jgi:hypothetical protein
MTPTAWSWLLAIVGTLASIAGVVFSWMAWVQAAKAKDAAKEAAAAVKKRSVAQELLRLAGDAKEFLAAVQQRRAENAVSSANGIAHGLAMIRTRSGTDAAFTSMLKNCENEITQVIVGLNVTGIPSDQSSYSELLGRCHMIHRTARELAGRMERLSEGETP